MTAVELHCDAPTRLEDGGWGYALHCIPKHVSGLLEGVHDRNFSKGNVLVYKASILRHGGHRSESLLVKEER